MGKTLLAKYDDPKNHTVTIHIGNTQIENVLVYLGTTINIMTIETVQKIGLTNLRITPTILEFADMYTIKLDGILDDLIVSVDSLEYLVDFLVLTAKITATGTPTDSGKTLVSHNRCLHQLSVRVYDHFRWDQDKKSYLIPSSSTYLRSGNSTMDGARGGIRCSTIVNNRESLNLQI